MKLAKARLSVRGAFDGPGIGPGPAAALGSSCIDIKAQRLPQQGRHVEEVKRNVLENINTSQ